MAVSVMSWWTIQRVHVSNKPHTQTTRVATRDQRRTCGAARMPVTTTARESSSCDTMSGRSCGGLREAKKKWDEHVSTPPPHTTRGRLPPHPSSVGAPLLYVRISRRDKVQGCQVGDTILLESGCLVEHFTACVSQIRHTTPPPRQRDARRVSPQRRAFLGQPRPK